jgi:hypothetical protein
MIFPATNHADHLLKNKGVHGRCKNPSSGMNGAEEKPRLVFRIKLPPAHNKGKMPGKVIKDRADEKPVPTLSSSMNCVEKKPPLVFKIKLPPSHDKEKLSFNAKSGKDEKLVPMASSGMSGTDGKKDRRLIKIKMPALRQNKEQLNIRKTVVQQTRFTNGSSAIPKIAYKSCLEKSKIDEELFELKLEATKKKLHQRYQQAQNTKRKIQLLDFQDIPKPENVTKRPKRC